MARFASVGQVRANLAHRHVRPVAPGRQRLSVVIPAYREAAIAAAVEQVRVELDDVARQGGVEVIVVDDGSGDGTAEAARRAGADHVVRLEHNQGKGAAVRAGVAVATGRTVAFTDADLSYAPAQLKRLLAEVEAGWDVVVGNRHHTDTTTVVAARRLRDVGGRLINLATRAVLKGGHRDTQCGLKAFRSDVAAVLFGLGRIDGFAFDVELLHLVERYGLSLIAVPVEVENSETSTVNIIPDALRLLVDLVRIRRLAAAGSYDIDPTVLASLDVGIGPPSETADVER